MACIHTGVRLIWVINLLRTLFDIRYVPCESDLHPLLYVVPASGSAKNLTARRATPEFMATALSSDDFIFNYCGHMAD